MISQVLLSVLIAASGNAERNVVEQQNDALAALNGEWVYVDDRTTDRALEQMGPPMSAKFSFRVEEGAVILVSGHGSGATNVKVALDGSVTEVVGETSISRYSGTWKDGLFRYRTEIVRASDKTVSTVIRKEFRITSEGLMVRVAIGDTDSASSTALYQHPQDIAMPTPVKATIGDLEWLSGSWVGTRGADGSTTIEERWGPSRGGSMLATSRTVTRGKMSAFEYLRIVEREGGLVYIAQPGGAAPTEFVLSEMGDRRAVFDNPRHDYPKRIVYELADDGVLRATIGFMKGGSPRQFEFKREGS